MIGEFFLNIIFNIVTGMFSMLPNWTWNVTSGAFGVALNIIRTVSYLLPMSTVGAIVGIIVSITIFRIVISIIKTIWELLPLV